MKNILGLVQAAPCRIDVTFREEGGAEYKRTAVVKGKGAETEELPLYTNHDSVLGEVQRAGGPPERARGAARAGEGGAAGGGAPHGRQRGARARALLLLLLLLPPPRARATAPTRRRPSPLAQVRITPLTTKRVEHSGVKVQLIGQIELASERGTYHDFISLGEPH
jgi:hypothetical protein